MAHPILQMPIPGNLRRSEPEGFDASHRAPVQRLRGITMHKHKNLCRLALIIAGLAGGAMLLGGCSRADSYRWNPTPEIQTLHQTKDEVDNRIAVTNDTNFRNLNEDIGRFFLLDRPLRLSNRPIPY